MHWLFDTLVGGVTYELLRSVAGSLAMALVGTALIRYCFDKLREKRQALTFLVGSFCLFLAFFFMVGTPRQQADFSGQIQQILTGPLPGSTRDTVAVVALNIVNSGPTQSIVKNITVQAIADGNTYDAMFIRMPQAFTFKDIPRTTLAQPTAITFHSEDNLTEKVTKPVEVGGEVTGLLFVEFSNVDQSIFHGSVTFIVSYQDAFSHQYSVSSGVGGSGVPGKGDFKPSRRCR